MMLDISIKMFLLLKVTIFTDIWIHSFKAFKKHDSSLSLRLHNEEGKPMCYVKKMGWWRPCKWQSFVAESGILTEKSDLHKTVLVFATLTL